MLTQEQQVKPRERMLLLALRQAAIIAANAIARYLELPHHHCEHCGAQVEQK